MKLVNLRGDGDQTPLCISRTQVFIQLHYEGQLNASPGA